MIWRRSLPGPRTVEIRISETPRPFQFTSPTKIPVILHVNSESRHEAKQQYQLAFGIQAFQQEPRVYINFNMDTIHLPSTRNSNIDLRYPCYLFSHSVDEAELRNIKKIRLSWENIQKYKPVINGKVWSGLEEMQVDFKVSIRGTTCMVAARNRSLVRLEYLRVEYPTWDSPVLLLSDGEFIERYDWV